MNEPLKQFMKLMDLSIISTIDRYRRTGESKSSMLINIKDLGVKRMTSQVRMAVEQYGKSIKVPLTYSDTTRAFHFELDLDTVAMSLQQAKHHVAAIQSRKEAA